MGAVHRGEAAARQLMPGALRHMGIGLGIGIVAAGVWIGITRNNRAEWEKADREFDLEKLKRKQEYEKWLATQPYDDEE